jgi:hypothetical protein
MSYPFWEATALDAEGSIGTGIARSLWLFFGTSVFTCILLFSDLLLFIKMSRYLFILQIVVGGILFWRASQDKKPKTLQGLCIGSVLIVVFDLIFAVAICYYIAAATDGFRWNLLH